MKTSNRLLLIAALFTFSSFYLSQSIVFSKYLVGDFTYMDTDQRIAATHFNYEKINFSTIKHIQIEGAQLTITIDTSDSTRIEYLKQDSLSIELVGDTLKVISHYNQGEENVTFPIQIYADNRLETISNTGKTMLYNINTSNKGPVTYRQSTGSKLIIQNFRDLNLGIIQSNSASFELRNNTFKTLSIHSNLSSMYFHQNTIDTLDAQLTNYSSLRWYFTAINHWKGQMDATTKINP
jgi:hypothetical protein